MFENLLHLIEKSTHHADFELKIGIWPNVAVLSIVFYLRKAEKYDFKLKLENSVSL